VNGVDTPAPEAAVLPTIALVVPWFGPLPTWFDLWLRSCAGNPSIDWLLFTDAALAGRTVPANVHPVAIDFAALRELFCERLELDVCLTKPIQLCDFKIAYGWIFAEWLADYEIWGYCDVDLIWGDLRRFFPSSLLRAYPKVQQSGHLAFYHNSDDVTQLFRQPHPAKDYRVVFTKPELRGFDEYWGAHELAYLHGLEQYEMHEFVDADPSSRGLRGICLRNHDHQLFYWEDGALYREYVDDPGVDREDLAYPDIQRDEFAYLHFQKRPMKAPRFDAATVRGFYITPDGFVQKVKACHCLDDFAQLNPRQAPQRPAPRLSRRTGPTARAMLRRLRRTGR
jgi:hypothetical protein